MTNMSRTGFVWHELYMWHDTGTYAGVLPSGHGILEPEENTENAATKRRIKNLLDVSGLTDQLVLLKPRTATIDELSAVHTRAYIEAIQQMSAGLGGDARMDTPYGHTPFGPGGYDIAALAAGGMLVATEAVVTGQVKNAYALVRPSATTPNQTADLVSACSTTAPSPRAMRRSVMVSSASRSSTGTSTTATVRKRFSGPNATC